MIFCPHRHCLQRMPCPKHKPTFQCEDVAEHIAHSKTIMGERNDCTVLAVAVAADLPYMTAHAMMEQAGRKRRRGMRFIPWLNRKCFEEKDAARLGEYKVQRVRLINRSGYPYTVTLAKFLRDFPRGTFIVCKSRHAFVVKDAKVINLGSTGARTRITDIWYLSKP